jgi:hypothetical protein
VWKCLGEVGIDKLTELMQIIWEEVEMPRECRDSVITPIYTKAMPRIVEIIEVQR